MTNNQEKEHITKLLSKSSRLDGRNTDEFRQPITVEYDVSKSAEGSARVKIGKTEVIAGIKMEVSVPYPDAPDSGSLMVGVELLPLSSPNFDSGPPSLHAIELSRVVDRCIRESEAMDMKKLCIKSGEQMWVVVIDICTINDAGNLFDACALAAMAALKVTKLPTFENDKVDYKNLTEEKLPLQKTPIAVTVYKIGNNLILDPTNEEEAVVDARLTVGCLENGNLCALQKGGNDPLSVDQINEMCKMALEKSKDLRKAL